MKSSLYTLLVFAHNVYLLAAGGGCTPDALPGAITIPTTPGGEGNPNLSKGVAPAGGWQPATRLSIRQRPKTCTAHEKLSSVTRA